MSLENNQKFIEQAKNLALKANKTGNQKIIKNFKEFYKKHQTVLDESDTNWLDFFTYGGSEELFKEMVGFLNIKVTHVDLVISRILNIGPENKGFENYNLINFIKTEKPEIFKEVISNFNPRNLWVSRATKSLRFFLENNISLRSFEKLPTLNRDLIKDCDDFTINQLIPLIQKTEIPKFVGFFCLEIRPKIIQGIIDYSKTEIQEELIKILIKILINLNFDQSNFKEATGSKNQIEVILKNFEYEEDIHGYSVAFISNVLEKCPDEDPKEFLELLEFIIRKDIVKNIAKFAIGKNSLSAISSLVNKVSMERTLEGSEAATRKRVIL